MSAIVEVIRTSTTLKAIYLDQCSLDEEHLLLSTALKSNSTLEKYYVADNSCNLEQIEAYAAMLKVNNGLKSFSINGNGLIDEEIKELAEALKTNTSLEEIDLSNNDFGDAGVAAVAEMLKVNKSLKKVFLNAIVYGWQGEDASAYNDADDNIEEAGDKEVKVVRFGTLTCPVPWIPPTTARALIDAIKGNSVIQQVALGYLALPPEQASSLVQVLRNKGASPQSIIDSLLTPVYLNEDTRRRHFSPDDSDQIMRRQSLNRAIQFNYFDAVKTLIEMGVSIENADADFRRSIHLAAEAGRLDVISLLHQHGAQLDVRVDHTGAQGIHFAALNGHTDVVEFFLNNGISPEVSDLENEAVIHYAARCRRDNAAVVKLLLDKGVDVEAKSSNKRRPLHLVAEFGSAETCRELLTHDADVNARIPKEFNFPLYLAVTFEHPEVVEVLLEKKPDIDARGAEQYTSLCRAAENGNKETCVLLLDAAAQQGSLDVLRLLHKRLLAVNGSMKNTKGQTMLHFARSTELIDFCLRKGLDINAVDNEGYTPLAEAARSGDSDAFDYLLSKGAKSDIPLPEGMTLLMVVAEKLSSSTATGLIESGADVNAKDKYGQTALLYTAKNDSYGEEVATCLLKHGASVDVLDKDGNNMLFKELSRDSWLSSAPVCLLLLKNGSKIMGVSSLGETTLHLAVNKNDATLIRILIHSGADIDAKDNFGKTPLLRSIELYFDDAGKALVEAGADTTIRDDDGFDALLSAIRRGSLEVVKMICENGGVINRRSPGKSPIDLARELGETSVLEYLLRKEAETK
ncbi:ankyrin repeat-containing domain protein [Cladochytrium replicatum]|nr:ankyrin repeat-containing domain protein [Cladochytrium replicatum]